MQTTTSTPTAFDKTTSEALYTNLYAAIRAGEKFASANGYNFFCPSTPSNTAKASIERLSKNKRKQLARLVYFAAEFPSFGKIGRLARFADKHVFGGPHFFIEKNSKELEIESAQRAYRSAQAILAEAQANYVALKGDFYKKNKR